MGGAVEAGGKGGGRGRAFPTPSALASGRKGWEATAGVACRLRKGGKDRGEQAGRLTNCLSSSSSSGQTACSLIRRLIIQLWC